MTTRIINDNTNRPKAEFSEIGELIERIADKDMKQLQNDGVFVFPKILKESDDLTKEQMVLRSRNGDFCSGNVMGFIGYEDKRLVIKSRFSNHDRDLFLQYLLSKVFSTNIVDLKTDLITESGTFDYLACVFPYYLKSALRKGLFKKYVWKKYNDDNIKGIIDIPRHITKNTPFIGKIAYNNREFSYDNYLTELIRHTIEYIREKPYGPQLLAQNCKDEVNLIVETTPGYFPRDRKKIVDINVKNPIRHAYFSEYQDLQRICIMILRNQRAQIGDGNSKVYGLLFDGAWLWEEYLNSLVYEWFWHPRNKSKTGGQYLFEGGSGLIYPDFIGKNRDNRIIADAKYKPNDNIHGADYLQLLAYTHRFEAKTGFYLYPLNETIEGNRFSEFKLNKGVRFFEADEKVQNRSDNIIIKYGIKIPQTEDYNTFVEHMKNSEKELLTKIEEINNAQNARL